MSTRSDNPAAATRSCASRCCSADNVTRADVRATLGGAHAQFAPTGSDFEHPAARADVRGVEQPVDLAPLAGGQVVVGRRQLVEQCARVRHRLVEELGEQLVGQVVVLGDVAPGLRTAVVLRSRRAHHGERAKPLQRRRNQIAQSFGELGEHARQVVGVPVAGHVGLAETDQPVAADPADEGLRPVNRHGGQSRICGADDDAIGIDEPHRQPCRRPPQQPVGDQTRNALSGPSGTCASAGQRSESIVAVTVPARSMLTVARPSPSRRFRCAARRGRRRSHSVMP